MTSSSKTSGIATRIRRLILVVTATTLFLAAAAYSTVEYQRNRDALVRHLQVLAHVIATNTAAAVANADANSAAQILRPLKDEPDLHGAVIYLRDGRRFAGEKWHDRDTTSKQDDEWLHSFMAEARSTPVHRFDDADVDLLMPILRDGSHIGELHLEGSLQNIRKRMLTFIVSSLAVLLLLIGGVHLLSNRLQRSISGPIRELAASMRRVSDHQDYSLRVDTGSVDEVADLLNGFNQMLKQIELRDRALAKNRRELEDKVEARTADLSDAKKLAEAGNRAKSEFLAMMSHEIRTPMNGVLGMTELLIASGLTPRQQRLAETAHRSAEGLLGVINNILDFSKIEAGRLELHAETFELRPLFDDTLEMLADQAHRKGIELIADLPPELAHRVSCDRTRLRQILINLVGNAVKFTDKGEVRLRAGTHVRDSGQVVLDVEVSDTGHGIPEEQQAQIFNAFFQAESSASRRFSGTGLGLSITQYLIRMMGGEISFDSEPGRGTRFTLSVEVDTVDDGDQTSVPLRVMSGRRVLIVDDHETNRDILRSQTTAWGMRSECAASADEALAMARKAAANSAPFEILILDWQMPGTDGIQLATAIKTDALIPPAAMIMLSSAGDDAIARQAENAGIQCYLTKPVRQDRLLACLLDTQKDGQQMPAPGESPDDIGFGSTRVLLAEDNLVNQEVALGMLEELGCEVDVVGNGEEAVAAFRGGIYDLVLMDCHMPLVDGFEATATIRGIERQQGGKHTPVVALTADIQEGIEQQCSQAGMDAYLSKPFSRERLTGIMARFLADHAPKTSAEKEDAPGTYQIPDLLDRATIEQLQRLSESRGRDLTGKVARLFLEQTPKLLERARAGVTSTDLETVRQAAHSIKSSSANVGALQLSESAAMLEKAARDGMSEHIDGLQHALDRAAEEAFAAIRHMLAPHVQAGDVDADTSDEDRGAGLILVVDDDPGFRLATEEALRAEGFAVETAGEGQAALIVVNRRQPDLILLDAVMEGMDGFDTCRGLRELPAGQNIPVIMVTGLDDLASLEHAFQAGATGFTTKPVSYPALIQKIRFMLRASHNETALRDHRTMLQTAQRVARLGYWRWDHTSGRFEMSDNLCEMYDIEPQKTPRTLDDYLDLIVEQDRERVRNRLRAASDDRQFGSFDYRVGNADDEPLIVRQDLQLIPNASELELLGTVQDVTAQRESENQVRRMAYFDALTGLASRSHLMQHLEDTIRVAHRRKEEFTILFLDLDGFKDVNDSLGHDIGDFMLVSIARRLQGMVRDIDFVARLGGDEFCILLNEQRDELDAAEVAARCLETINEPIELGQQRWRPHVSIGLARFPIDGDTAGLLLKAADSAMYAAKKAGKHRYAFYRPEMTQEAERRLATEQLLREAIEKKEFEVYYQPQIDMRSGQIKAVEALVRWHHPQRGLVLPGEFIATLERVGLISELGDWVIRQACRQTAIWASEGLPEIRVAVNISPLHFHDPSIQNSVGSALAESGLTGDRLEIEITESSVQSDSEAMVALRQLQELGVRISIDDFGTGYSSLSSLKHLPINTLKIDRMFITDIMERNEDAVMLGTIVGLAHALGYAVVAEGVEQEDQAIVLAGLNCDLAQGFLFSRPVPADQVGGLLKRESFFVNNRSMLLHDLVQAGGHDV